MKCKECGRKIKSRVSKIIQAINETYPEIDSTYKNRALELAHLKIFKEYVVNVYESNMGGKVYRSPVFLTSKEIEKGEYVMMGSNSDIHDLVDGRYAYIEDGNYTIASGLEPEIIKEFNMH